MKDLTVKLEITIREAMKALDNTAEKCLLVINDQQILIGTLTDGDLRRGILSGMKFSDSIIGCYHKNPTTLINGSFSQEDATQLLRRRKLDLIPIVDVDNKVIKYLTWLNVNGGKKTKKKL